MKYVFIFFLFFILGIFIIFAYKNISQTMSVQQLKSPLAKSQFSPDVAPSTSLTGRIVSLTGDVGWQSRVATAPTQISTPREIQQGEEVATKDNGHATIVFENILNLLIAPKTEVDFVQTLPENILIAQNSGSTEYSELGTSPISIRCLSLLTTIVSGDVSISVNENRPIITVNVKQGSITAGYNDSQQITQTLDVTEGNVLIFNTDTKTVDIEPL